METVISLVNKVLVGSNCNFRVMPHQVTKILIKMVKMFRNIEMPCHNIGLSVGRAYPGTFLSVNMLTWAYLWEVLSAVELICKILWYLF